MSYSTNINQYILQQLDPNITAKNFCDLYYSTIMAKGFIGVMYLFDFSSRCNYNGVDYNGFYNIPVAMAQEGVMKLTHDKLISTSSVIDNETLFIQVFGSCQGITFWNFVTPIHQFVETFILKYLNGAILVANYTFRLV